MEGGILRKYKEIEHKEKKQTVVISISKSVHDKLGLACPGEDQNKPYRISYLLHEGIVYNEYHINDRLTAKSSTVKSQSPAYEGMEYNILQIL